MGDKQMCSLELSNTAGAICTHQGHSAMYKGGRNAHPGCDIGAASVTSTSLHHYLCTTPLALILAAAQVLMSPGDQCFRGYGRRNGERRRKSVRGCIVSQDLSVLNLVIVKKGERAGQGSYWTYD